jgi:hypothetical protein
MVETIGPGRSDPPLLTDEPPRQYELPTGQPTTRSDCQAAPIRLEATMNAFQVIGVVLAGVLTLAGTGALWQAIAGRRDHRRLPPPGELVDVGGHRPSGSRNRPTVRAGRSLRRRQADLPADAVAGGEQRPDDNDDDSWSGVQL